MRSFGPNSSRCARSGSGPRRSGSHWPSPLTHAANFGFEQSLNYWNPSSIADVEFEAQSSGGQTGPRRARMRSTSSSEFIYQRVSLETGNDNEEYCGVVAFKVADLSYGGTVKVTVVRKGVTYAVGDNGCQYPDGLDLLDPNTISAQTPWEVLSTSGSIPVSGVTSWAMAYAPWTNPAQYTGYWLEFRVYGTVFGGGPQWLLLDNARLEGT